jgi:hypothetical protein
MQFPQPSLASKQFNGHSIGTLQDPSTQSTQQSGESTQFTPPTQEVDMHDTLH